MVDSPLRTTADVRPAGNLSALAQLRRHWLVWPARHYRESMTRAIVDAAVREVADDLLASGCPVIVRRQSDAFDPRTARTDAIAAGLPLAPAQGKLRLAFTVPLRAITRTAPPPTLADVVPWMPAPWTLPLRQLDRHAREIGIELRVYGSALWQALTGRDYITSRSDIDLVWRPANKAKLDAGIALLRAWENHTKLVADGEIHFGDDAAVAWREWRKPPRRATAGNEEFDETIERIVVKSLRGAKWMTRGELMALIEQHGHDADIAQTEIQEKYCIEGACI